MTLKGQETVLNSPLNKKTPTRDAHRGFEKNFNVAFYLNKLSVFIITFQTAHADGMPTIAQAMTS
jgi:hypothetical protein